MVRRGEITDQAWHQIEPLLHEYGQSGGRCRDHRTVINGILWKLYAPDRPGVICRRGVEWEVSVDGTVIRAHQHAAGARDEPSAADVKRGS